jgi:hypothetical protein
MLYEVEATATQKYRIVVEADSREDAIDSVEYYGTDEAESSKTIDGLSFEVEHAVELK